MRRQNRYLTTENTQEKKRKEKVLTRIPPQKTPKTINNTSKQFVFHH